MMPRMRSALGALVTLALMLGISQSALGSRVEVGAGALSATFAGNDGEGPTNLTFLDEPGEGRHPIEIDKVHRFRFANGCSVNGSTVPVDMTIDSSGHFDYVARGFTVQGTFAQSDSQASGTARVDRGGCDSGVLTFTVTLG
jgi:hypothetical protein